MDWVSAIRKEAQTSSVLNTDDLSRRYGIGPIAVTRALSRQEGKGLVEHIGPKIYLNLLARDASPLELVNVLRQSAYVSLESALREFGISTQTPQVLTCVTTERPREFSGRTIRITYRAITPRLYWGFTEKKTRYGSYRLAEPEKALLDWIYLNLQVGAPPALDELEFDRVSRGRVLAYARRFPASVYRHLLPALAERKFAA